MVSPSRKHPLLDDDDSANNTLFPQSKRRRTTMDSNPTSQNHTQSTLNTSFNSSSAAPETPRPGFSSQGSSFNSNLGQRPGTARGAASSVAPRALPVRSFAPKPLQSPFAARAAARRNPQLESSLRYMASLREKSASNGVTGPRPSTARSVASSPQSRPAPKPTPKPAPERQAGSSMFPAGRMARDARFTANRAAAPAAVSATPAPPRRIHNPNFRSERKAPPKPPGQMFHFSGNRPDTRSYNAFEFNPFDSHDRTPARAPSIAPSAAPSSVATTAHNESRIASFTARATAASSNIVAKADGINSFLASAVEKARKALIGNREDKNEERKANEKEAIRKRIEEEQRIKRDEIFREEMEQERMDRDMFQRAHEAELHNTRSEGKGKEVDQEWEYGGVNDPSFVTEDTIPDTADYTPNGFHAATVVTEMVTESVQVSSTVLMSSSPITKTRAQPEQLPVPPSAAAYASIPADTHEESSEEESDSMEIVEQPKQHVISIDSDDETEEVKTPNPHLKFDFTHPRKLPGVGEDEEGDMGDEAEEGEFDEYAEYDEEYDEEETGEFEDEEEEEEEEEEVSVPAAGPKNFIDDDDDDDEIEETIEDFGEEPAANSSDSEGGQDEVDEQFVQPGGVEDYTEEETEKDESDLEGVLWAPKAKLAEDVDRSLDSTVVIGGLSQQNSFTPVMEVAPNPAFLPARDQESVPEIIVSSPGQTKESTPVSPNRKKHAAKAEDQGQEPTPRPLTSIAAEPEIAVSSPAGLIIIDDDATDAEPGEGSDALVAEIEEYEEFDEYHSNEAPVGGKETGIIRDGEDVYNRYGMHIGACDENGYVWADIDEMVIGWISAKGQFHELAENLEDGTRSLSKGELFGKPKKDEVDVEVIEDDGEEEEEEEEEEEDFATSLKEIHGAIEGNVGDSIEKGEEEDLGDAIKVGVEEDKSETKAGKKIQAVDEEPRTEKTIEVIEAPTVTNVEPEDKSMYGEASSQLVDAAASYGKEQPEIEDELMIEEEEQIGIDFHHEHENRPNEAPNEVVFTPAKGSYEPFFHFHDRPQPTIDMSSPYRFMSNDELSKGLKLEAGRLVVKSPSKLEVEDKDEIMEENKGDKEIEKENEEVMYPELGQDGQKDGEGRIKLDEASREIIPTPTDEPLVSFHFHPQTEMTLKGLHKDKADVELYKSPSSEDQAPVDPELSTAMDGEEHAPKDKEVGKGVEENVVYPELAQVENQAPVDTALSTSSKEPAVTSSLLDEGQPEREETQLESVDEERAEPVFEAEGSAIEPEHTTESAVLMEESKIKSKPEVEQEAGSDDEADDEADETMLTAVEEPEVFSLLSEGVIIIERDDVSDIDEQDDETSHSLRPDSVDDRNSMIRELFRENTVEEQVIEWQVSERRESYSKITITMEGGDRESTSDGESDDGDNDEMEEEGAVDEEAPVDEERAVEEARVEEMAEKAVAQQLMGGEMTEDEVEVVVNDKEEAIREDELAKLVEQSTEIIPEVGAEADVEDAADSSIEGSGDEDEAMLMVDLGLANDGEEVEENEPTEEGDELIEEAKQPLEVEDEELDKEVGPINVNVENDKVGESTPTSKVGRPTTPPAVEPGLKRKRRESSPPKPQTGAQLDDAAEEKSDQEITDNDVPLAPSHSKKKRRTKGRGGRKRKSDASELKYVSPKESSEPEVDGETKEPKAKRRRTTRSTHASPGSAGTPTPTKETKTPEDLYLEDEKLEEELRIIETAVATALDPDIPPEQTVQLTDGSIVPAIQPEKAGVSLGKELRDGKVIETVSPPRRMTRKRARETSAEPTIESVVEPKARAAPKSRTKKAASINEPSAEPENAESGPNLKDDGPAATKRQRRGRSASVEPSIPVEAKAAAKSKAKPRAKKTSSIKEPSIEPEIAVPENIESENERKATVKPKAKTRTKKASSIKESSAEPDIVMSENNEQESAEPENAEPSSVRPGSRRGRSVSVEPSVLVESKTSVKSKAKKGPSTKTSPTKETSAEPEAVAVNHHESTEFSADDTDRSSRGVRRSTRGKKVEIDTTKRENVPVTPTNKRLRKQPIEPLSAIKEAEVEATVKKATRASTRKKAA